MFQLFTKAVTKRKKAKIADQIHVKIYQERQSIYVFEKLPLDLKNYYIQSMIFNDPQLLETLQRISQKRRLNSS